MRFGSPSWPEMSHWKYYQKLQSFSFLFFPAPKSPKCLENKTSCVSSAVPLCFCFPTDIRTVCMLRFLDLISHSYINDFGTDLSLPEGQRICLKKECCLISCLSLSCSVNCICTCLQVLHLRNILHICTFSLFNKLNQL